MKICDIEDVSRLAQERIKLAGIYDELCSPTIAGTDCARVSEVVIHRYGKANLSIGSLTHGTQILNSIVEGTLTNALAQLVADRVVAIDRELAAFGVEVES